jgi:dipeptidyl-peptidase-4
MIALFPLVLAVGVAAPFAPEPAFLRDSAQTKNYMLGRPSRIKIAPDGSSVLFLRSPPRESSLALYEYVVATGETRELITPAEILKGAEEQLSVAERARRERQRIQTRGFTTYELSEDGRVVLVPLSGRLYAVDRVTKAVRGLYDGAEPILDPQLSPDGKSVAYVKANDVWVADVATGKERRVTTGGTGEVTHGLAEFVAQEEMDRFSGFWWSPDSSTIAFEEADHRGVERFTIADPAHPEREPDSFPYPRPGKRNVQVRLGLVKASGGKVTWVEWDRAQFEYLARVIWKEKAAPLTIVVQSRDQQQVEILTVDPKGGKTKSFAKISDPAWVNLDPQLPMWLPDGSGLLVGGPRMGLSMVGQGALLPAGVEFIGMAHVPRDGGPLKVLVSTTPTSVQLAEVPRAGGVPKLLTTDSGPAEHDVVVARNGSIHVDTKVTADAMPQSTVYRADGTAIGVLPSVAEAPGFQAGVELTSVEAGGRSYHAAIVRPRGYVGGRRYPVVLSVYGGPHVNVVRANQAGYLLPQWIADHGVIVISIDNRGTPRRGRAWETAIDGSFADVPLDDQVAALRALGARLPELDLERVGIYGWSFGGYLSALAVLRRPDVFKVGVAGAPVVDWHDYDTHYTERYLETPERNTAGYEASNLLTYAGRLERPLLLIHGTGDDNVYFFHTLKLADALFKAGRPFELLPLTGTHMVADPAVRERLWERITAFLLRELKPAPQ